MSADVDRVVADLEFEVGEWVREVVIEVIANLTEATPRVTGWAANNWFGLLGSESSALIAETVGVALEGGDFAAVLTAAAETLAREGAVAGNGVPYLPELNDGSSTQAPSGFIQSEVAKAVRTVNARDRPKTRKF